MVNEFKCATWRYGPNGEAQVFTDSREVPEGWLDHPAKFSNPHFPHDAPLPAQEEQPQDGAEVTQNQPAQDDAPPAEFQPIPLTRDEIMSQLKERNVSFRVTAKTAVLYTLLLTTLERENDAQDETE